jgi:iron complex outermembrane receptor protein
MNILRYVSLWSLSIFALVTSEVIVAEQVEARVIEEIIITAQRREQSLQTVPVSVAAFDGETLDAFGIDTSEDLAFLVPGLDIAHFRQGASPFLRAIGNPDTGAGNEASVALYVDGVYIAAQTAALFSLLDVERVEVLRGPQGTLFGRNATGGLIHLITRDPSGDPTVEARVGYGNYGAFDGTFYGSTRISENLSTSLAVLYKDQNKGYGINIPTGIDNNKTRQFSVRNKWALDLGETKIKFSADYTDEDTSRGVARSTDEQSILFDGSGYLGNVFDTNWNLDPAVQGKVYGANLEVRHDFGWAEFVSISAARSNDSDFVSDQDVTPLDIQEIDISEFNRTYSQEFQLVSAVTDKFDWITGVFLYSSEAGYDRFEIFGGAVGAVLDRVNQENTKSGSIFSQGVYKLSADTNLTMGIRYTEDKKNLVGTFLINGNAIASADSGYTKWSEPTWRLALDHQFNDNVFGFVSYDRGFKSGVFNTIFQITGEPVRPEILDAYEAGLKMDLMEGTMRLNTSVFVYDHQDIQLTQILGAASTLLLNAAQASVFGVEVELQKAVTDRLQFRGTVAYLDAEYDSFPGAPHTVPNPGGGNTVGLTVDASGTDMIRAPKWTASLLVDYTAPIETGELSFGIGYYYNDGFFWESDHRLTQDSYSLINASIMWMINENFGIELWGKNLTDETYLLSSASAGFGDLSAGMPPLTYGISFSWRNN